MAGMGGAATRVEALARVTEETSYAEPGCRCPGVVPGTGARIPVGDQPGAAEGDDGGEASFEL